MQCTFDANVFFTLLLLSLFPIPGSTLPISLWLFPVVKFLQIEACLLSSCPLDYLFSIDDAVTMFFAFGNVCADWSDAFNGEFSLSVIFRIATQTAPKLLPSSLPGVDRRLRGVENAERSLSHSRYHCSVLLRFDRLLGDSADHTGSGTTSRRRVSNTCFLEDAFTTLSGSASLSILPPSAVPCCSQVNCPS